MRRRLLCEQRGAISVLAALSLLFVIASAAMTVDVGQAAWKKRDLQKVVDVVSLDAVRAVGDRRDSTSSCITVAEDFAKDAAERNDFDYGNTTLGNSLILEVGVADGVTKSFSATSDCNAANAVRVTATSRSDNRFMPGNVGLTTQAIAMNDGIATFLLGSRLVSIDTTTSPILNSVLGGMLGGAVNLSAIGYNGLATASVRLGDIWTNLGLGTSSQIANSEVTVGQLLTATIDALNDQGDPTSVTAATVLGTLATQVDSSTSFKWGDLLEVSQGEIGDAANARMDVLNMVGMVASVANGTDAVNLTVPVTIPGVTTTTMKLAVIEPPVMKRGRPITTAHTGQVRMNLDLTLTQKLTVLLSEGTVHLPVYVEGAGATGDLTAIACSVPNTNSAITVRTTTEPVIAKVGQATDESLNDPEVEADVRAGQIVSISGLVNVTGTATATMPGSVTDLLIPLHQTATAGASSLSVAGQLVGSLALSVQVLGLGINATTVANNTLAILNPVLSALDSTLLTPLKKALGSLGIALGAADVTNMDTNCSARRLIG